MLVHAADYQRRAYGEVTFLQTGEYPVQDLRNRYVLSSYIHYFQIVFVRNEGSSLEKNFTIYLQWYRKAKQFLTFEILDNEIGSDKFSCNFVSWKLHLAISSDNVLNILSELIYEGLEIDHFIIMRFSHLGAPPLSLYDESIVVVVVLF